MPDHDTTPDHDTLDHDTISAQDVISAQDAAPVPEATALEPTRGAVIRQVLERQLVAGQGLGTQLVGASTELTVALVHAPVAVIDEIRTGATLPAALAHTRAETRGVVAETGTRVRTAIGEYVTSQATLPNAVVCGAADVAEAVLRGQGIVAGSALDSVFTVATIAARGGAVREALGRERRDVAAHADAARAAVAESWDRAFEEIRDAVEVYDDEYLEDFSDED
ncbi:hypothetical protein TUM20985_53440 [Mycobacterium antarcticum]|uniref:hypothetical protein n=1 Tax=unclassified Mycolicibacterium TaxID=2636767 RepID=UPI00238B1CC6|nr:MULTISPECIES: hypothetical protein [unclassified Mycolicibacterium]BDX34797.1 hypothetical protein TUM20985_53440 [Mycolicibacterium sp. TUM20985]GLP77998.1 hypothetical protein TUM20983_51080 [Mycolicibacterium sp. TUM20983]GLP81599.1 hypothetical protein TUM20984_30190 [Mycolicibacterium sp. TUM20984]